MNHKHFLTIACLSCCVNAMSATIMQPVYLSSSGSNRNDGLSPSSPWKDVGALNGKTFGPGAQILFMRGETFPGAFTLAGSGTPENPIVVAAYGDGEKPKLTGSEDAKEVIRLTGNEGIEFRDLAFSNFNTNVPSIMRRYGITLEPPPNAGEMRHLRFLRLDFSSIQGAADAANPKNDHMSQGIWGHIAQSPFPSRWNGLRIEGCTFSDIDGRGVTIADSCHNIEDVRLRGCTNYFPTVGLVFQNNHGTNIYRNLLMISGTKDALIQCNTMDTTVCGSAFWPFATEGTLVQYNIFKHLRNGDSDAFVCHFDYNCIGTVMQYNYGYDVEGGLIEFLVNSTSSSNFQEGAIARYNVGIDVGWRAKDNGAGILFKGGVDGAQAYNNTIVFLDRPVQNAIACFWWGPGLPKNCTISNNVFTAIGSSVGYKNMEKMSVNGNTVEGNHYRGNLEPCPVDLSPVLGESVGQAERENTL